MRLNYIEGLSNTTHKVKVDLLEFASKVGVDKATVDYIWNGRNMTNISDFKRLCNKVAQIALSQKMEPVGEITPYTDLSRVRVLLTNVKTSDFAKYRKALKMLDTRFTAELYLHFIRRGIPLEDARDFIAGYTQDKTLSIEVFDKAVGKLARQFRKRGA